MIVDELIALLGYRLTGQGDLAKFNSGIKGAERNLAAFAATAARWGAIAGAALGAGAVLFGKSLVDVGKQFEGYNIQLETLLGSKDKAKEALSWIQDFAKSTPLEIGDVTEAYVGLKNFGIDPTNGSLQALTDAMAGSGKGVENLKRLTIALGQAWVKQKLQGDEIMQLTEAGIPVWDMLSKSTGKSVQELQKLSAAGKLGRKEIQLLIDAIGKKYLGASAKFAKSFAGITSNLWDNWTQFLKRIDDAGLFEFLEKSAQGFLDKVNQWADDGTLDRWAKNISGAMIWAAKAVGFLTDRLIRDGAVIAEWLGKLDPNLVKAFGAALVLLAAYLFPLSWAFFLAALAIDDFLGYLDGADSKFGDFVAWIQNMTGASEGLAQALAAIAASLLLIAGMRVFSLLGALGKLFAGVAGGAAGEIAAGGAAGAGPRSGGLVEWLKTSIGPALTAALAAASINYGESDAAMSPEEKARMDRARKGIKEHFRPQTKGGPARYRAGEADDFDVPTYPDAGAGPGARGKKYRRGMEPAARSADTPASLNQDGGAAVAAMIANLNGNVAKLAAGAQPGAVVTDNSQDLRSYPVTVNASTTINVTEAAAAAAAAVGAVSNAVGQAAVAGASRIEKEPAF